jgi:hypothetical protein
LEDRTVPSVSIQFDYHFDDPANGGNGFFFSHPEARQALQASANYITSRLGDSLPLAYAVNTLISFDDPDTGTNQTFYPPQVAADTVLIYVGARPLASSELGQGGPVGETFIQGDISAVNRNPWQWIGSITFDDRPSTNWYFGTDIGGISSSQTDFYSVAMHEIGHVLGLGTSQPWKDQVQANTFIGHAAQGVFGRPVPVDPSAAHFASGTIDPFTGQAPTMSPSIQDWGGAGTRRPFTALDFAALTDIGWRVTGLEQVIGNIDSTATDAFGDKYYHLADGRLYFYNPMPRGGLTRVGSDVDSFALDARSGVYLRANGWLYYFNPVTGLHYIAPGITAFAADGAAGVYYRVTGSDGDGRLYYFDPLSGQNATLVGTDVDSIAADARSGVYLRANGWLYYFNPGTGLHPIVPGITALAADHQAGVYYRVTGSDGDGRLYYLDPLGGQNASLVGTDVDSLTTDERTGVYLRANGWLYYYEPSLHETIPGFTLGGPGSLHPIVPGMTAFTADGAAGVYYRVTGSDGDGRLYYLDPLSGQNASLVGTDVDSLTADDRKGVYLRVNDRLYYFNPATGLHPIAPGITAFAADGTAGVYYRVTGSDGAGRLYYFDPLSGLDANLVGTDVDALAADAIIGLYLQSNGRLYYYNPGGSYVPAGSPPRPITSGVTSFAADGQGGAYYLRADGSLSYFNAYNEDNTGYSHGLASSGVLSFVADGQTGVYFQTADGHLYYGNYSYFPVTNTTPLIVIESHDPADPPDTFAADGQSGIYYRVSSGALYYGNANNVDGWPHGLASGGVLSLVADGQTGVYFQTANGYLYYGNYNIPAVNDNSPLIRIESHDPAGPPDTFAADGQSGIYYRVSSGAFYYGNANNVDGSPHGLASGGVLSFVADGQTGVYFQTASGYLYYGNYSISAVNSNSSLIIIESHDPAGPPDAFAADGQSGIYYRVSSGAFYYGNANNVDGWAHGLASGGVLSFVPDDQTGVYFLTSTGGRLYYGNYSIQAVNGNSPLIPVADQVVSYGPDAPTGVHYQTADGTSHNPVPGDPPVSLSAATLPNGAVGSAYSQTVFATGGTGTKTVVYTIISGSLPGGLNFTTVSGDPGTLIISGTPTAGGSVTFQVTATDDLGGTATHTYSLIIDPAPSQAPSQTPPSSPPPTGQGPHHRRKKPTRKPKHKHQPKQQLSRGHHK